MGAPTRRMSIVLDAISIAVQQLAKVPDSLEVQALRAKALAYESEVKQWTDAPPTTEQREAMMKRVLALNASVTKLARQKGAPN